MTAIPSTKEFFDRLAPKRERDARRHAMYYKDRRRWLMRLIPDSASVIDVGCGIGITLGALPQKKKTGIDFSDEMIRIAKERDKESAYIVDNALHLQHEEKYDYVLLLDTINYLQDVQLCLRNVREKLCHEHTRVVVTYYNFLWQPFFMLGHFLGLKTRFPEQSWLNRADVENLLEVTGFEVVRNDERVLMPVGIPFLTGFFNRFLVSLPFFRMFALVKCTIARPLRQTRRDCNVTILSAVRNEKGNIRQIANAMPKIGTHTELLFVEGHSSDGTWGEIEKVQAESSGDHLTIRGLKQTGVGKANALHEGIEASGGDLLFIYDGDFTMHPSELMKLYDVIADGRAEFVNASRLVYPLRSGSMQLLNMLGNKIFSVLFSWLFRQQLKDVLSPVKAFLRKDYIAVTTRMDPFGDFDFFLGAAILQLKMREVPIHYLERTYGVTKIRRFHHGWLLLKMCWKGAWMLRWY